MNLRDRYAGGDCRFTDLQGEFGEGERDEGERDSLICVIFFASSLDKSHSDQAVPFLGPGYRRIKNDTSAASRLELRGKGTGALISSGSAKVPIPSVLLFSAAGTGK